MERAQDKLYKEEQKGRPAYLPLRIKVTCADTNGIAYFTQVVDFTSITKGGVWPHALTIPPLDEALGLRSDFDVKLEILTPSERGADRAYLYTMISLPNGLPEGI